MNWTTFLAALSTEEKGDLRSALEAEHRSTFAGLTEEELAMSKFDAIRSYRNRTHCGLIDAKRVVERFMGPIPPPGTI